VTLTICSRIVPLNSQCQLEIVYVCNESKRSLYMYYTFDESNFIILRIVVIEYECRISLTGLFRWKERILTRSRVRTILLCVRCHTNNNNSNNIIIIPIITIPIIIVTTISRSIYFLLWSTKIAERQAWLKIRYINIKINLFRKNTFTFLDILLHNFIYIIEICKMYLSKTDYYIKISFLYQ